VAVSFLGFFKALVFFFVAIVSSLFLGFKHLWSAGTWSPVLLRVGPLDLAVGKTNGFGWGWRAQFGERLLLFQLPGFAEMLCALRRLLCGGHVFPPLDLTASLLNARLMPTSCGACKVETIAIRRITPLGRR
jgi:hypothetical protein